MIVLGLCIRRAIKFPWIARVMSSPIINSKAVNLNRPLTLTHHVGPLFDEKMLVYKGPSLIINDGFDAETTLVVDINEPPNWDALQLKSIVKSLKICGENEVDMGNIMLNIASIVQSHHGISSIAFEGCKIVELGSLCVANRGRRDQLVTLQFDHCTFDLCAAQSLQFMLEDSSLSELIFSGCIIDERVAKTIDTGLRKNRSLTSF
jgi:hypothetical protein